MAKTTAWVSVHRIAENSDLKILEKYNAQKINTASETKDLYSVDIENIANIKDIESVFGSVIWPKYNPRDRFKYLDKTFTVKKVESVCINGVWKPAYETDDGFYIYEHQLK